MRKSILVAVVISLILTSLSCKIGRAGKVSQEFIGHTDTVKCVALSADGRRAISGGEDGTIRIWDVESGKEIRSLQGMKSVRSVALSYDGRRAISGSYDNLNWTVRVWDVEKGKEIRRFEEQQKEILSVLFKPDGRVLYATIDSIREGEIESGQESVYKINRLPDISDLAFGWFCFAFSPDGRRAIGQFEDRALHLIDLKQERELLRCTRNLENDQCVTFSADGRRALSGSYNGGIADLWDLETGRKITSFKGLTGVVLSVAFSPDGKRAAAADGGGNIHLFDVEIGSEITQYKVNDSAVMSVTFSPNGKYLLTGGMDKTVRLWKLS
jgi:WD40 repeat protein